MPEKTNPEVRLYRLTSLAGWLLGIWMIAMVTVGFAVTYWGDPGLLMSIISVNVVLVTVGIVLAVFFGGAMISVGRRFEEHSLMLAGFIYIILAVMAVVGPMLFGGYSISLYVVSEGLFEAAILLALSILFLLMLVWGAATLKEKTNVTLFNGANYMFLGGVIVNAFMAVAMVQVKLGWVLFYLGFILLGMGFGQLADVREGKRCPECLARVGYTDKKCPQCDTKL